MEKELTVEVIEKIGTLTKEAVAKENRVIELDLGNGPRKFETSTLKRIYDDPRPSTLDVSSLTAITTYIKEGLENVKKENIFIRIVSPTEVELLEAFSGEQKTRTLYMRAGLSNDADPFKFGQFYESESFVIRLMTLFEETDDREIVITVASSLCAEAKIAKTDDKQTTKTQANQGVINTSGIEAPRVVLLRPFRTFRQIEQPESSFIFRYRASGEDIGLALFEADGGAWKHEAMRRIADFFKKEVPELKVIA